MPIADAPSDWEGCRRLVAPRYRRLSSGRAPEGDRLEELAAGLLLARVLGVVEDRQLSLGQYGKPELVAGAPHVSIAHDAGLAVLAVCEDVVGTDVEEVPPAFGDVQRSALRWVLSDEGIARVDGSDDPALAFARAWTRVEAVLKADGRGLRFRTRGGRLPEGWSCSFATYEGRVIACAARDVPEVEVRVVPMGETIGLLEGVVGGARDPQVL